LSRSAAAGGAVAGIVDRPNLHRPIPPVLGEEGRGQLSAGGVADECEDVGLVFLVSSAGGAQVEDLDLRSTVERSFAASEERRVERVGGRVEDQTIGLAGKEEHEE